MNCSKIQHQCRNRLEHIAWFRELFYSIEHFPHALFALVWVVGWHGIYATHLSFKDNKKRDLKKNIEIFLCPHLENDFNILFVCICDYIMDIRCWRSSFRALFSHLTWNYKWMCLKLKAAQANTLILNLSDLSST